MIVFSVTWFAFASVVIAAIAKIIGSLTAELRVSWYRAYVLNVVEKFALGSQDGLTFNSYEQIARLGKIETEDVSPGEKALTPALKTLESAIEALKDLLKKGEKV